jgi:predicted Fe-S protein YdhL (DUF1289 family)
MADIASPCNQVCAIDPLSAQCVGCGRTLAEIERWSRYSADERRRIMAELPGRLARAPHGSNAPVDVT